MIASTQSTPQTETIPVPTTTPTPPQSDGTLLRLLMVLGLYAIPVLVALRPVGAPIVDPDVWWHLRVGQWVVEHRTVPTTDPLSQLDKPWVAYSWLYEVLVFGLHQGMGLWGIILYRVVLSLAVVAAFHHLIRKREPRFLVSTLLAAVAMLAIAMLFSERPWLFTLLFTALTLDVVLDLRAGKSTRLLWLLPILYALWGSLHIQFVYGLFILGLGCIAPLLDRPSAALARLACVARNERSRRSQGEGEARAYSWLGQTQEGDPAPAWGPWHRKLLILTGACVLATLVNPYHVRIYQVIVEYATQPGAFRYVNELKALEFREPCGWLMLGLAAGATFMLGRRRYLSSFNVLLLAAAAVLAFRARRDIWFLVLASLAVFANSAPRQIIMMPQWAMTPRRWAFVAVGVLLLAVATAWLRGLTPGKLDATVARVFPVEAARVVRERGYPGPLYNDFNWGGYLSWGLPDHPVVVDGRTNLHGDERILRIGGTWAGTTGWEKDPDLNSAGVVLANPSTPLAHLLVNDPRFARVHRDDVAWVFVARSNKVDP